MLWSYESRTMDERKLLQELASIYPVIVTDLHQRIVGVNRDWVTMCKYTAEEAFGRTPTILQGPLTNHENALDFSMRLRLGHPCFASLLNYKKDGTVFVNHVFGWCLGDLLIAETYAEDALQGDRQAATGIPRA